MAAFKLITMRAFLAEISDSIANANQRLIAVSTPSTSQQFSSAPSPKLEVSSVTVSFAANVVNRSFTGNSKEQQHDILLDFSPGGKKESNNIYAEVVFTGNGKPANTVPEQNSTSSSTNIVPHVFP